MIRRLLDCGGCATRPRGRECAEECASSGLFSLLMLARRSWFRKIEKNDDGRPFPTPLRSPRPSRTSVLVLLSRESPFKGRTAPKHAMADQAEGS